MKGFLMGLLLLTAQAEVTTSRFASGSAKAVSSLS